jgi:hypothetical protein
MNYSKLISRFPDGFLGLAALVERGFNRGGVLARLWGS